MKSKIVFTVFVILGVIVISCRGLFSQKYEFSGRLLNYMTHEPIAAKIVFYGQDPTTAKNMNKPAGSTSSNTDGYFVFSERTTVEPKEMVISGADFYDSGRGVSVEPKKNIDLGNIYTGVYTFTIKINLVSTTGSSIFIENRMYSANTDTVIYQTEKYTRSDYSLFNKKTWVSYYTEKFGIRKDSSIRVELPSKEIIELTINY